MILDRIMMWIYVAGFVLGSVVYYSIVQNYVYPKTDECLLKFIKWIDELCI